jgi:hypothetical protein
LSWAGISPGQAKSPLATDAGGLLMILPMSLTVLRSVHSAPPTWSVHDDGGGWDGVDCSSQALSYAKRVSAVKSEFRYLQRPRRGIIAKAAV